MSMSVGRFRIVAARPLGIQGVSLGQSMPLAVALKTPVMPNLSDHIYSFVASHLGHTECLDWVGSNAISHARNAIKLLFIAGVGCLSDRRSLRRMDK